MSRQQTSPGMAPPSYNQAVSEGTAHQPPPGMAKASAAEGQPYPSQPAPAGYGVPPQAGCGPPQAGYGPPQAGYGGPPQAGYGGPPQAGYGGPPQAGYGGPPQAGYGGPPQAGYGGPQQHGYNYGAGPGLPYTAPPVALPVMTVVPTMAVAPGSQSTHMVCPQCHAEIETAVNTTPSTTAWISGGLIFLFGCWMGCCLIPCCMDECMDKEHTCPNCKAFLGKYRR